MRKDLILKSKKSVVFLGYRYEGQINFIGTGFMISYGKCLHLVTAKHVLFEAHSENRIDENLMVCTKSKDGDVPNTARSINDHKNKFDIDWVFHQDSKVDIAIIPFGASSKEDFLPLPENIFLDSDRLIETDEVFYCSFQPGMKSATHIQPIVRRGFVSIVNEDKSFVIDGHVFPGNSGSPVFLNYSLTYRDGQLIIDENVLSGALLGLIGSYIPYDDVAVSQQTGKPRVVFQENTGLSNVWSVNFIREILTSQTYKEQLEKIGLEGN